MRKLCDEKKQMRFVKLRQVRLEYTEELALAGSEKKASLVTATMYTEPRLNELRLNTLVLKQL